MNHLRNLRAGKAEARNPFAIEEEPRKRVVQRVVRHTADTDGKFYCGIPEQRALDLLDHLARNKAAYGKAAHVNAEREHLAVTGMPEEEFKVARPRTFVNQARKARKRKQEVNKNVHGLNLYKNIPRLIKSPDFGASGFFGLMLGLEVEMFLMSQSGRMVQLLVSPLKLLWKNIP